MERALHWQRRAACRGSDPEAFFPPGEVDATPAKYVYAPCEVQTDCLEYALRTGQRYGVWGGHSEEERYQMLFGRASSRGRKAALRRLSAGR